MEKAGYDPFVHAQAFLRYASSASGLSGEQPPKAPPWEQTVFFGSDTAVLLSLFPFAAAGAERFVSEPDMADARLTGASAADGAPALWKEQPDAAAWFALRAAASPQMEKEAAFPFGGVVLPADPGEILPHPAFDEDAVRAFLPEKNAFAGGADGNAALPFLPAVFSLFASLDARAEADGSAGSSAPAGTSGTAMEQGAALQPVSLTAGLLPSAFREQPVFSLFSEARPAAELLFLPGGADSGTADAVSSAAASSDSPAGESLSLWRQTVLIESLFPSFGGQASLSESLFPSFGGQASLNESLFPSFRGQTVGDEGTVFSQTANAALPVGGETGTNGTPPLFSAHPELLFSLSGAQAPPVQLTVHSTANLYSQSDEDCYLEKLVQSLLAALSSGGVRSAAL